MPWWGWVLVGTAVLYAMLLLVLLAMGRRADAEALLRYIPDRVVFARRLATDPRVPLRWRVAVWALVAYLVTPIDLVPDFIPVLGLLDDAILIAVVLRGVMRAAGPDVVREHMPALSR